MRRLTYIFAASSVAYSALAAGSATRAQAFVCSNCSTEMSSLAGLARQAMQYSAQIQQLQTQLQSYANMVQNTIALPQEIWSNVRGDIMQVEQLSNAASVLSGNSGSIIGRLNSAGGYASQAANLGNIANQFTTWQQTIGNNLSTLGRTLGLQQEQMNNDANIQAAVEAHSQTAAGALQAIQAATEMAQNNGAVLSQIHATLITTAQLQANQMAVDADRRALQDAATLHIFQYQPVQTTGGKGW